MADQAIVNECVERKRGVSAMLFGSLIFRSAHVQREL